MVSCRRGGGGGGWEGWGGGGGWGGDGGVGGIVITTMTEKGIFSHFADK